MAPEGPRPPDGLPQAVALQQQFAIGILAQFFGSPVVVARYRFSVTPCPDYPYGVFARPGENLRNPGPRRRQPFDKIEVAKVSRPYRLRNAFLSGVARP